MDVKNLEDENRLLRQRLFELEERYKLAVEVNGDGIWDWDLETNEVFYSPKWKRMLGLKDDEVGSSYEEWEKRVHPEDKDRALAALNQCMMGQTESYENEHRILCKDGTYRWILDRGRVIEWIGPGKPRRMIGTHIDITKQKQMEKAIKESSEKFHSIFNQSPIAIMLYDLQGTVLALNKASVNAFGISHEDVIKGINLFSPPIFPREVRALLRQGQAVEFESELDFDLVSQENCLQTNKSGIRIFAWRIHPFMSNANEHIGFLGHIQDVTEQRKAEKALKYSEEKLRTLLDSLDAQVFTLSKDHRFTGAYGRWLEKNSSLMEIFLHKTLSQLVNEGRIDQDRAEFLMSQNDKALNGESVVFDWNIIWQEERRYFQTALTPILNDQGEVEEVVGIGKDVTEFVESREEIRKAKEAAEEANKAKSQFLANMSHEIRTPMNGILGAADLLMLMNLTNEQQDMVSIIKSSGKALLKIINDILDLSKIEAGRVELEPEQVKLTDLLNQVSSLLMPAAKSKGLSLSVDVQQGVPERIMVDKVRLLQVLNNLVGNAIKFTRNGEIKVSIEKSAVVEDKVQLLFSVWDTGIGIRQEELSKLFNRFTQLDDALTKRYEGTGLGLVISKRLVELMDGEIHVESEYGKGSRFYFTCLVHAAEDESKTHIIDKGTIMTQQKHNLSLLLVEDDYVSQLLIKRICRINDWHMEVISDGESVLGLLDNRNFDLILMDIQIPGISGFDVTKMIRQKEKRTGHHIPIIAATAYARQEDRERCLNAGMDDYISKPIDLHQLKSLVRKWTGK